MRLFIELSRGDELNKAYEKIAAGVKYRTKDETDQQVEISRTVEAIALAQGCNIEELIKRLAREQGHRCKITGIPFEPTGWNTPSPDRIDSSDREYADGKIQIVCRWINFAKGNKPADVFRALLEQAVDHMGKNSVAVVLILPKRGNVHGWHVRLLRCSERIDLRQG